MKREGSRKATHHVPRGIGMVDASRDPTDRPDDPAAEPVPAEEPTADTQPAQPQPVLALAPERLLAHELDANFLGTKVHADLYLTNAFRLLAMPATTTGRDLEPRIQRLRQMSRLSPARAVKTAAPLGYEQYRDIGDPASSVSRLSDPRVRIFHEIFWPHLGPDQGSWPAPADLAVLANAGGHGPDSAVVGQHALAIAHHNQAISHEIEVAYGRAEWSDGHWLRAHIFWQGVVSNDAFWAYISRRVKAFDDPRLRGDDVARIRAALPGIVLSYNGLFTRLYANAGNGPLTAAHVRLIQNSPFAQQERLATLNTAVEDLARFRVGPWTHQVEQVINAVDKKYTRKEFDARFGPMVNGVSELAAWLSGGLGLDLAGLELGCFDEFVLAARTAINAHIDYQGDDDRRSILYSSLVFKRLLGFPITTATRHKLEESIKSDSRILYKGFLKPRQHDFTECWFLPGEPADPDASLLYSMYKITHRAVFVRHAQGTAGVSVSYDHFRVLVPRSRAAATQHGARSGRGSRKGGHGAARPRPPGSRPANVLFGVSALCIVGGPFVSAASEDLAVMVMLAGLAVALAAIVTHQRHLARHRNEAKDAERRRAAEEAKRRAAEALERKEAMASGEPIAREQSAYTTFPVFAAARQDDFNDGSEPTGSEMEMTYSEREEARRMSLLGGW